MSIKIFNDNQKGIDTINTNNILNEQLTKLINLNQKKQTNYTIYKFKNTILIKTKDKEYTLNIMNENNVIYLKLIPYKDSYFQTKLKNIDAIFIAIKDDSSYSKLEINGISIRKQNVKNVLLTSNLQNIGNIWQLFNDNYLDKFINKLNDETVIINSYLDKNKNYLTSEEQFLQILDNYITFFNNKFTFVILREIILKLIFINNNNEFLLCKKYIGDNNQINYFKQNYILFTIETFYKNCQKLYNFLEKDLNSIDINIDKININNNDDAKKILDILINLCIINKNSYDIIYLFKDIDNNHKMTNSIYDIYVVQWKNLIKNYHQNINFLNEYQKFINAV